MVRVEDEEEEEKMGLRGELWRIERYDGFVEKREKEGKEEREGEKE